MRLVAFGCLCFAILHVYLAPAFAESATLEILHSFNGSDGKQPRGGLIRGSDENFYGVTTYGGIDGTVFRITPQGSLTTLHSLVSIYDGAEPHARLVQAGDGNLYGTASQSGGTSDSDNGTVFRITPEGSFNRLYTFNILDSNGWRPFGELIQASDGNLYGTTSTGGNWRCPGSWCGDNGAGTVFQITTDGIPTKLHTFFDSDGRRPMGGLIEASDGNLYGTTSEGGLFGRGTVFRITPEGSLTVLHSFDGDDGAFPSAGLIQADDGHLYGTTEGGGNQNIYCARGLVGCGTVFRITLQGVLTSLHAFNFGDGAHPTESLMQASDSHFYGTTLAGGNNRCTLFGYTTYYGCGTVFQITRDGDLTTFYSFDGEDGFNSDASLVEESEDIFWGTEMGGGDNGYGTIFKLTLDDATFVPATYFFWPRRGSFDTQVWILGRNLKGATAVLFNDVAAPFIADLNWFITAWVPAGARTGRIKVVSPGGTATTFARFWVTR